ncbi:hypothetical protein [Slackia heliotrinireducens]|uniref:hypothetical protein n=1 Tax=Slackia heliotrinireducens TaxID=84110 RepID=UPI0033146F69
MAARSYEQQLAEYDAQLSRIKARKHALVARSSKAERKARTHALIVMGGLVKSCFEDEWQAVDWDGLASIIEGNKSALASKTTKILPTQEAVRRLRNWERQQRNRSNDEKWYARRCRAHHSAWV